MIKVPRCDAPLGCVALVFLLTACAAPAPQAVSSRATGYVLAGQNVAGGFANNALVAFDARTMTIQHRTALPRSWARHLARDPDGNLWIGFSGNLSDSDRRVQVYSPQGRLLETLQPCTDPEAGITFAAGRAFIACAENGLSGKVVIVSLETMDIEKTLTLSLPGSPLVLITSAANEQAVVITGLTSGPEEASYSVITLVDPRTLEVQAQILAGKNTDVWRILPHGEQFYLLNAASYRQPREQANDLLILTPGISPTLKAAALAPSPVWGAWDGNVLYTFHNPAWNSTVAEPQRQVCRLDVESNQMQQWALPDGWNASDLAIIEGQIILVKWEYWSGDANDGLYRFDPATGQLSLLLNVPDASAIAPPR